MNLEQNQNYLDRIGLEKEEGAVRDTRPIKSEEVVRNISSCDSCNEDSSSSNSGSRFQIQHRVNVVLREGRRNTDSEEEVRTSAQLHTVSQ